MQKTWYFDQYSEFAATKRWSKYTTDGWCWYKYFFMNFLQQIIIFQIFLYPDSLTCLSQQDQVCQVTDEHNRLVSYSSLLRQYRFSQLNLSKSIDRGQTNCSVLQDYEDS